jgi:L-histidine Nalpha-methyltransferase
MTADAEAEGFRRAVLAGLARRPRRIPCKYLYDAAGSALFERICTLDEYYLTRTETALLRDHGGDIARLAGPGRTVVDLGAGSMEKARLLLSALEGPAAYVPIDIAREPLLAHGRRLAADFPALQVAPVAADFTGELTLPPLGPGRMLAFFPGSTIGNMRPNEAAAFLARVRRMMGRHGLLLIGVDLVKDAGRLHAAYDDRAGVTAAFIRNLLVRMRRELGSTLDPAAFDHRARWNARLSRVEIHLVSRHRQRGMLAGQPVQFRRGHAIHIENCYKYEVAGFHRLAARAGLDAVATWTDPARLYSLHLLAPRP